MRKIFLYLYFLFLGSKVQKMVDEADKDGTGLLTEKEFMQSSATEVSIAIVSKLSLGIKFIIIIKSKRTYFEITLYFIFKDLNKEKPSDSDRACAAPRDSGKQAEIAFRLYDKDKDGYITKVHLKSIQWKIIYFLS